MVAVLQHLQRGSEGPAVVRLQQRLNELGADPPLETDGIFGALTEAAVKSFQSTHGLEADGIVGPLTRAALGGGEDVDFNEAVAIPSDINPGVSECKQATMLGMLGEPCALTSDCSDVTNARVRGLLVTDDVGPFRVSGLRPAVEALTRIFADVQAREPALFAALGTAGMLCCRRIRTTDGSISHNYSNHSWGAAVDIKINDQLDPRANGTAFRGLLMLHPFFNKERFYWGAGFGGVFEDSMHFEASDELVREWNAQGLLG